MGTSLFKVTFERLTCLIYKTDALCFPDLLWAQHFHLGEKYLLAVHPPSSLVVWDVITGTKVYKKTYTEQLLALDLDPFDPSRLACKYS